jgi:Ala-tRNA(Pro) deacylase
MSETAAPLDRAAEIAAAIAAQSAIPTSPAQLLARLAELGISTQTTDHDPVFTVEERMWLVTVEENRRVDLKWLGEKLTGETGGAAKLSFGSADRLMTYLGVIPGAVTPFAVINDKVGKVKMVLDRHLLSCDPVFAHPLVNFKTTAIAPADLLAFLEAEGHKPQLLDFA